MLYYFCLFLYEFNSANIFWSATWLQLHNSCWLFLVCGKCYHVNQTPAGFCVMASFHRSHFCLNLYVLLVCPYNSDGLILSPSSSSICTHFLLFTVINTVKFYVCSVGFYLFLEYLLQSRGFKTHPWLALYISFSMNTNSSRRSQALSRFK